MSTIDPSIFKPDDHEHKSPELKHPEPKPETSTATHNFTPRETPKTAQHHELSRTVYSHVARLRVLLTAWQKNRNESFKISKAIYALNLHQYEEDYFPRELQPLMDRLIEILGDIAEIFEEVNELKIRLQALAKLQPSDDPVLTTWSVKMVAETLINLGKLLKEEYRLLETAIENIAHDRNEHRRDCYVASLSPTPFIANESAFLFSEAGLTLV